MTAPKQERRAPYDCDSQAMRGPVVSDNAYTERCCKHGRPPGTQSTQQPTIAPAHDAVLAGFDFS